VKGYSKGNTPAQKVPAFFADWATDQRVAELIKEGKYESAFALLSPENLEKKDINSKIEYDLLSAIVVGKENPRLYCGPVLDKYPQSIAWTMRICRFLKDWRKGKKSNEDINSIREQLQSEDPKRMYYVDALKNLL
jgi:hypothetical protein